jgi:hypothetical protein
VIDPRWVRWLIPGMAGMSLALLASLLASLGLAIEGEPGALFEAVLAAPFAFVFLRGTRSLFAAAGADAPVERRVEGLADVGRALQLTGGLSLLAVVFLGFALLAVGARLLGG